MTTDSRSTRMRRPLDHPARAGVHTCLPALMLGLSVLGAAPYSPPVSPFPPRPKPTPNMTQAPQSSWGHPHGPWSFDFGTTRGRAGTLAASWKYGSGMLGADALDGQVEVRFDQQQLRFSPPASVAGLHFAAYRLEDALDLTGDTVGVAVSQVATHAGATTFAVVSNEDNLDAFEVVEGRIYFLSRTQGADSSSSSPYNGRTQRFWRFRHDRGSHLLYWETSGDGATWAVERVTPASAGLKSAHAEISVGTLDSGADPGTAVFDAFFVGAGRGGKAVPPQ